MTNVFKTPDKKHVKNRLFQIGLETLRNNGWNVERIPGGASVRQIVKGNERHRVSIRTTQSQWIAFPRQKDGDGWGTLPSVDVVLAVSVDDVAHPRVALVHWLDAGEMRARFDRNYHARLKAEHQITLGRGIWIPLYIADDQETVRFAGGGAGLDHPPIARVPLNGTGLVPESARQATDSVPTGNGQLADHEPLTIAEAKRRLALTLGVPESSIKISVEA